MKHKSLSLAAAMCALLVTSCGPASSRNGDGTPPGSTDHAHAAPHGGSLVELGDHEYAIEFVVGDPGGRVTAYVLDAHGEEFIRLPLETFEVEVQTGEEPKTLVLGAVANAATGETVGNTSQFAGEAAWLSGGQAFDAVLKEITIRGKTYRNVRFTLGRD